MFLKFFANLRQAHVPVTPREYLDLMRALEGDLAQMSVDEFYRLARRLVEKRAEEVDPPVNVADGENLHVRAYAARQPKSSSLDNCRHRTSCAKLRRGPALHAGAG